ncbi:MAG: NADH-ubiquinone oxidoreductase-F iron-sulfur binding region domain-containing protein [Pirellulales bacterium]
MKILRELTRLQHELGYLEDATLRQVAERMRVPLYRIEGLVSFYPMFRRTPPPRLHVNVCRDICCRMARDPNASAPLLDQLRTRDDIEIREVSCLGRCDAAPALAINGTPVAPRTMHDLQEVLPCVEQPASLSNEPNEKTRRWKCDPYADASQRYGTVRSLVEAGTVAATCIERLEQSRLRGMGGAGFPTGRKWELVFQETATPKYVICNADESEPGTFKDRVILDELPHLVIEGMLLAGLTVGAERGIVFLRHEYGREHQALQRALQQARAAGVLGPNAANSDQAFDIEVFVSPGGYILGEETALLEALEDKRGEPRHKPPYPGTHGLWGQPTLINNVETFALATSILHHGATWWEQQSEGDFSGLKFVSISGDVVHPGVHEIPLGTTVRELIRLAGGMPDGESLKAFLPGGASSNFLTAAHADTPLDFDRMQQAGSMLGTGAVIVLSERRDLFDMATSLVRFFRNESCGKCLPCRLGTEQATEILQCIQAGNASSEQLQFVEALNDTLQQTSICGLGQVALNPLLSLLKHFPDDVPQ